MKRTLLVSLAILLMILGSGCQLFNSGPASPESPPESPAETEIDLDSPTGGFTDEDEEPAFGEPELYEPLMNETEIVDSYEKDEAVQEMLRHRNVKIYRFRAIWGRLAVAYRDTLKDECCRVDWTGTLHLDGGVILIEKVIAFENNDEVTRVDRSTISWVSHTCPHVDGIQVKLIVPSPPEDSTAPEVIPKLTISTAPFSRTFTMEELEALEMMQPVDRCGNGISINSHIIPRYCPHGYLVGAWRTIPIDTIVDPAVNDEPPDSTDARGKVLGVYRGIWIDSSGLMGGYLRGVFGVNSQGEKVFFGKYIDINGKFRGILRGYYGPSPTITADAENRYGWFHGVWVGKNGIAMGRLKGHWMACSAGYGYFHGVWGMICSNSL